MLIPRRHAAAAPPASRPRPRRRRPAHRRRARPDSWRGRRAAPWRRSPARPAPRPTAAKATAGVARLGQALLEGGGGREQRIQHGPVAGLGAAQVADGLHGIAERAGPVARRRLRASRQRQRERAARWRKTGRNCRRWPCSSAPPSAASAPAGSAGPRRAPPDGVGGALHAGAQVAVARQRIQLGQRRLLGVQRRRRRAQRRLQGSDPALAGGVGAAWARPAPPARRRGCPG